MRNIFHTSIMSCSTAGCSLQFKQMQWRRKQSYLQLFNPGVLGALKKKNNLKSVLCLSAGRSQNESSSSQTVTLGMCAILHDKYQWFAPGFRLLLTGSHCLSWFTQMETILSQHSHKNQSGLLLVSPPFHCTQTDRGFTPFTGPRTTPLFVCRISERFNFRFHKDL